MNETNNQQRFTEEDTQDTSGLWSGDMQATSQFHSGVYRIENGELTHTPTLNSEQIITPAEGLAATAVKQSGFGKPDMSDPNTLVTINGVQASIGFFESLGVLERTTSGELRESQLEVKAEAPTVQENPDEIVEKFHPDVETEIQHFVKAMHPVALSDVKREVIVSHIESNYATEF